MSGKGFSSWFKGKMKLGKDHEDKMRNKNVSVRIQRTNTAPEIPTRQPRPQSLQSSAPPQLINHLTPLYSNNNNNNNNNNNINNTNINNNNNNINNNNNYQLIPTSHPPSFSTQFQRIKLIGVGMSSKVYLVVSKVDQKYYALKVIPPSKTSLHQNEINLLSSIQHPHIVKLCSRFVDNEENTCLLMDFIPGGELFIHIYSQQNLRSTPYWSNHFFSEDVVKYYASEIVDILGYLHCRDIVYRDLKPENILLDSYGHINLVDFGSSKDLGKNGRSYTVCGTPEYFSPEMVLGTGHGKAVDWWALGVLIFEMLSGHTPFRSENDNQAEIFQKILEQDVVFPSFFSNEVQSLLRQLLTRDYTRRLGSRLGTDLKYDAGSIDVKNHPWFAEIEWNSLFTTVPPIRPILSHAGDARYCSNVDEEEELQYAQNTLNIPNIPNTQDTQTTPTTPRKNTPTKIPNKESDTQSIEETQQQNTHTETHQAYIPEGQRLQRSPNLHTLKRNLETHSTSSPYPSRNMSNSHLPPLSQSNSSPSTPLNVSEENHTQLEFNNNNHHNNNYHNNNHHTGNNNNNSSNNNKSNFTRIDFPLGDPEEKSLRTSLNLDPL